MKPVPGLIRSVVGLTALAGVVFVGVPSAMDAVYGDRYDINGDNMLATYNADGAAQVHEDATVLIGDQGSSFFVVNVPAKAGGAFPGIRLGLGSS